MTLDQLNSLTPGRQFQGLYSKIVYTVTSVEKSTKKGIKVFAKRDGVFEEFEFTKNSPLGSYEVIEEGAR